MRNKIRSVLVLMCLIFAWGVVSSNAYALVCYLGTNSSAVQDTDKINVLAYLDDKGIGEKIWHSREFSRNISCRSQLSKGRNENVFIYPFPKRDTEALPAGVKLGLIFNGKDLGTFEAGTSVEAGRVDTEWNVGNVINPVPSRTMTFQVYLVRTGEISTDSVYKLTIFQLDGIGGLNAYAENYNIAITGWMNIGSVNCKSMSSSLNTSLSGFQTDSLLKGEARQTVQNGLGINVSCTSPNPMVLDHIHTAITKVTLKGSALAESDKYFATNKEKLGLALRAENKDLLPGVGVTIKVPFTAGAANSVIPLEVTPHLTSLSLHQPSWLFSEADAAHITSSIPYTVSVDEIEAD